MERNVGPETSLTELALLFGKLGTTAFGGPAAHIAMMENEVVRRRAWMTREQFLDLLGATNLIPGPNSTEMAIHIGHARRGFTGLLVAGVCFITPAVIIVTAIAWAYVRVGHLPASLAVLDGVKPVVIAIIAQALWRLGRMAIKTRTLALIGIGALIANAMGVSELFVLFASAMLVACIRAIKSKNLRPAMAAFALPTTASTMVAAGSSVGLLPMFLVFLKIGSVLFGSGYVLLAFLRADFVERLHWLTETQLLDATAVGQVTPGPLFTTATFIGYLLAGPRGAIVATVGIFLPAFIFVAISAPLVPKLRKSPIAGAFLDGLNVASLALMALVTFQLGRAAVHDIPTLAIALLSAILLFQFRINSVWLVIGGALVGIAVAGIR